MLGLGPLINGVQFCKECYTKSMYFTMIKQGGHQENDLGNYDFNYCRIHANIMIHETKLISQVVMKVVASGRCLL